SHLLFFSKATPPSAPSPLSLHDALPIYGGGRPVARWGSRIVLAALSDGRAHSASGRDRPGRLDRTYRQSSPRRSDRAANTILERSEEHTSELQSLTNIVCRLLL